MNNLRLKVVAKSWWFAVLVTVLFTLSVRSAVADWNDVPSGSMRPTILEGDRIYVNKLAYDLKIPFTTLHAASWQNPQRGDIVVFRSPADGKRLVKRVIGLPGDSIAMDRNHLFINGVMLGYDSADPPASPEQGVYYLNELLPGQTHRVQIRSSPPVQSSFQAVTVPDDSYFMLGDNRDNSADSRFFGFVPRKNILGRATAVAMSLDINGGYKPRWERFFTPLK